MQPMLSIMMLMTFVVFLIVFVVVISNFQLWLRALLAGAQIQFIQLIGMRLRKENPKVIVDSYIIARKGGVDIGLGDLETHYLARGNVPRLVMALVAAKKTHYPLTFEQAAAIDLAGRDPLAEVKEGSVDWEYEFKNMGPNTPTPIEGNCRDGSRVGASVKVRYSRPVKQGASEEFPLHAEIALRLLTHINDAESFWNLENSRDEHESELLAFGHSAMRGLQSLELRYFEV
jgi:uncharacterized protein YqfA (UPF0365 family)